MEHLTAALEGTSSEKFAQLVRAASTTIPATAEEAEKLGMMQLALAQAPKFLPVDDPAELDALLLSFVHFLLGLRSDDAEPAAELIMAIPGANALADSEIT